MSRQSIAPPPATPPRYGFIAAVPDAPGLNPRDWMQGFQFNREECGDGNRVAINCAGGNPARTVDDEVTGDDIIHGDPFLVWTERHCTTRGFAAADYRGRAERQLAATVSYELANEFWTGALRDSTADPDVLDNAALTDIGSDTVTNGGVEPHLALALLVGALGQCSHGSRGMVHVTPQLLVELNRNGAVYRDGQTWLTPMGHIVVADDGYDGTGPGGTPAGATQWAYATSMVTKRLGGVNVPGADEAGAVKPSWTDRARNRVLVYADQPVAFQWDSCCHVAAEIALPVPLVGPPS